MRSTFLRTDGASAADAAGLPDVIMVLPDSRLLLFAELLLPIIPSGVAKSPLCVIPIPIDITIAIDIDIVAAVVSCSRR